MADEAGESGSNTPAGNEDDFFSSWDKPAIKRPSNPPSRTGTPAAGVGRTASPFLNANANGNGTARAPSPLVGADAPAAATSRAIPAAARKPLGTTGAKKSILGAKKTKLGAKKVDASALDFDAAEKKAKEEAERVAKLGYDPDAEATPAEAQIKSAQPAETPSIISPTPLSPGRPGGFGSTGKAPDRSESDVDRLGMGVRKLGFGQMSGGAPAAAAAPKKMGFGSVNRAPVQGNPTKPVNNNRPLTFHQQTTRRSTPATSLACKRAFHLMNSSAVPPSTHRLKQKQNHVSKVSKAHNPSHPTPTLAVPKRKVRRITATWRVRPRTLSANLASQLVTTWRTCRICLAKERPNCKVSFPFLYSVSFKEGTDLLTSYRRY